MAIQEAYENLARFNREQHWFSFTGEERSCYVAGQLQNVPEFTIENKPFWLLRLFYEYIWKPECYQLSSVIPKMHQVIEAIDRAAYHPGSNINKLEMHEQAIRIYRYFQEKCGGRHDLFRGECGNVTRQFGIHIAHHSQLLENLYRRQELIDQELIFSEELRRVASNLSVADDMIVSVAEVTESTLPVASMREVVLLPKALDDLGKVVEQNLSGKAATEFQENRQLFRGKLQLFLATGELIDAYRYKLDEVTQQIILRMLCVSVKLFNIRLSHPDNKERLRAAADLERYYSRLVDSFLHCTNRLSTEIEDLYFEFVGEERDSGYCRRESIEGRVVLALQRHRMNIRDAAVRKVEDEHGAATHRYYRATLNEEFGLPQSIGVHDERYGKYARQGHDAQIRREFQEQYCPESIIRYISDCIHDPENRLLPGILFQGWIQSRFGLGSDNWQEHLLESGLWRPSVIAQMLQEQGILRGL